MISTIRRRASLGARVALFILAGLLTLALAAPAGAEEVIARKWCCGGGHVDIKTAKEWADHYKKVFAQTTPQRHQLTGTKIDFQVTFLEDNTGFNDPVLGDARKAVLYNVLEYLDGVLDHPDGALEIFVEPLDGSAPAGVLASAGPFLSYPGNVNAGFFDPWSTRHITTGIEPDAGAQTNNPDISVVVNFANWDWHLGGLPVPAGEYDLYSTLLHEMLHGLGFLTWTANENGQSSSAPDVIRTTFDRFLYSGTNVKLFNETTAVYEGDGNTLLGGDNGVFLRATSAAAAYGGDVPLFTPPTFSPGSSISHWDEPNSGIPPESVMRFQLGTAQARRVLLDFELGALGDLGYTLFQEPVNQVGDWAIYE